MDRIISRQDAIHPGAYVKQNVIPKGMTVKKAAELLRVGRPALSNFLNCNADLSKEMAVRLERTFGADGEHLIDLQARFDHGQAAAGKESVVSGVYAPQLADIKAVDIQRWAEENIGARQELPALLRRLVHSTGRELTRVDFPAFDEAERRGWDGLIETSVPTPWIPDGKSGWEISCHHDPIRKADSDFVKRTAVIPRTERNETTFVFVTAHNWSGKRRWAKEKTAINNWKEVRAYDASDLEQWLEQSAAAQIWFAERLSRRVDGFRSIERCWREWTEECEPPLWPALFAPSVKRFVKEFTGWLSDEPNRPFILAADSQDEALAYLRCLATSQETDPHGLADRMIVFDSPEALRRLDSAQRVQIVAVISTPEAEKRVGGLYRRCHCVIIRPRNSVYGDPDIVLDRLHFLDFQKGLESNGYTYERIERVARESGCSLTILRRRLSNIPEVQTPSWAGNAAIARKLIPAAMVGTWNFSMPGDGAVVRCLARTDDDAIVKENVGELLDLKDAPLWAAGEYRGVTSRIDALFGIAYVISDTDLDNFLNVAEHVLSKKEPAIDLQHSPIWTSNSAGAETVHSAVLRRAIRETLVILAVHGNRLFSKRINFDAEARVNELVSELLSPFDRERVFFCAQDLPDYAEAAPEIVLSLVEDDLQKAEPVIPSLMRPLGHKFSSPSLRTPVLQAFQVLAWNPQRYPRVAELLATICTTVANETQDTWSPNPRETLDSFFRSWWPQTAASLKKRVKTLRGLCRRYPAIGWDVCIGQLDSRGDSASSNCRPRWRDDKATASPQVSVAERSEFNQEAIRLALNRKEYDEKNLGDLVEHLQQFDPEQQRKVWDLIDRWIDSKPSVDAAAILRLRINGRAQLRRRRGESIAHPERERSASHRLFPKDKASRQEWLFASHRVELALDGSDDRVFDYQKEEQRLSQVRVQALREIWEGSGFEGLNSLLEKYEAMAEPIGGLMAIVFQRRDEVRRFFHSCLYATAVGKSSTHRSCLSGFVKNANADLLATLVDEIERTHDWNHLTTLLLCMPFKAVTWRRLDDKPADVRSAYWKMVIPLTWRDRHGVEEINECIRRLLAVNRANAAFRAALVAWDKVGTSLLKRLLEALPAASQDEFLNDPMTDDYNISVAFDELDKRPGVTVEEKARLEYAHIVRLDRSEHGVPNVEKQIDSSPELYAWAVACVSKRADGKEDPSELNFVDPKRTEAVVNAAYTLLGRISRIPGTDDSGNINAEKLKAWLGRVRSWCARRDRAKIGDDVVGSLMARAPADEDGIWPCRPVCEALLWMASEDVANGFIVGARSRRGAHFKGPGGDQERNLASRYRAWAGKLVYEYPYVGRLLEEIADTYDREAKREDIQSEIRDRLLP